MKLKEVEGLLLSIRSHDHNTGNGEFRRKEAHMKHLLKVPEAASRLNLSVKTTWKMVYGRKFDIVRIGRSVRITAESIDELIDDGTIPADRDYDGDDEDDHEDE
jgi:excisionase family DNA binding protein